MVTVPVLSLSSAAEHHKAPTARRLMASLTGETSCKRRTYPSTDALLLSWPRPYCFPVHLQRKVVFSPPCLTPAQAMIIPSVSCVPTIHFIRLRPAAFRHLRLQHSVRRRCATPMASTRSPIRAKG